MALFRKRTPPPRPVEFSFFDDGDWAAFNDEVRRSVRRLKLDVERFEPGAVVTRRHGRLGLLNVAQVCNGNASLDWPALIDHHFLVVTTAPAAAPQLTAAMLRVRLLPDDFAPPEDIASTGTLVTPFAESVVAVLAFDLPETVRMATVDDIAALGLLGMAAWETAWEQTRANERPDQHEVIDVGGGAAVHSFVGESFFVASLVRFLPDLVGGIDEQGALVSIPRRHSIFAHPIRDLSAATAVQSMIPGTRGLYLEGPGSVSAHLYWWRAGELTWLPAQVEEERTNFYPPDEFVEVLNSLPPAAG